MLGHYQLSAPVGMQIGPGEAAQVLHHDDAVYPLPWPHAPVVLNTMWALCDFTAANGATRLIPGSHRWEPEPASRRSTRPSPPRCRPGRCCSTPARCGTAAAPTPPTDPGSA